MRKYFPPQKRMLLQLGVQHCGKAASLGAEPQWEDYLPAGVWGNAPRNQPYSSDVQ